MGTKIWQLEKAWWVYQFCRDSRSVGVFRIGQRTDLRENSTIQYDEGFALTKIFASICHGTKADFPLMCIEAS